MDKGLKETTEKQVFTLEEIAEQIMTNQVNEDTFYGWELRKGKTTEDINRAVKKGRNPKYSFGKFELEVEMIALYLKDVLKKTPLKKRLAIHSEA